MADVTCPFCGFQSTSAYRIQLHIEEHHTEDSPFVASDDTGPVPNAAPADTTSPSEASSPEINGPYTRASPPSEESMPEDIWTKCTRPQCGEYVLLADVDDHLEVHEAIAAAERDEQEDTRPRNHQGPKRDRSPARRDASNESIRCSPQKLQKSKPSETNGNHAGRGLLQYFTGSSHKGSPPPRRPVREPHHPGRLGKRELGPHAFEKVMPADVRRQLLNDGLPRHHNRIARDGRLYREAVVENETVGLIKVLADLCALDPGTEATYFCDPSVRHVTKLRCDGNFCGYWNIQMLLSYLQSKQPSKRSSNEFELLPNIFQIQDTIEQAWDNGVCSYGRIETGGIRGTRKWIGTHETVAYFTQSGIKVEALCFKKEESDSNSQPAVLDLLDHVEAYFMSGLEGSKRHRTSYVTSLAPIYFQRFGHSMTIVGMERKEDGWRNLLVFDPSFETADGMKRLLGGRSLSVAPETLLKAYRRSDLALSRWEEFEIVVPQPTEKKSKG